MRIPACWMAMGVVLKWELVLMASANPMIPNGRKTHVEMVRKTGHTFTLNVAGHTDPVMRRLEIHGPVEDPKVVCDRWIDPETPRTVLRHILKPGMTEREKAIAIFWWCQENCSRNTPWIWDDARFASTLGFGHCGPTGFAQSALCNAAGLQWHQMRLWAHNCIQIWYDNRWHVLDAYMRAVYPGPDGTYAASGAELAKFPELIDRHCGPDGRGLKEHIPMSHLRKVYSSYDGGVKFELGKTFPWDTNKIRYRLRAGERLVLWWDRREVCSWPKLTPSDFTNGQLIYEPDLRGTDARKDVHGSANVRWGTGKLPVHVARTGQPAEIVWEVSSYCNLMTSRIEGTFARGQAGDVVRVSVSADGGKTWKPVWQHEGTGPVEATIDLKGALPFKPKVYTRGLRSYLAKVEMTAAGSPSKVGIASIRFATELLMHNRALPRLLKGKNKITVTATSVPRPLKIVYEYNEVVALAADRYDPTAGQPVTLEATVSNPGDAPAEDVRVQFYDGDPAGRGKPIGKPVVIARIAPGKSAVARLTWRCESTPDRGPYYQGSPGKPFYYCHSNIHAVVNPGKGRPTAAESADLARFHLYIRQKPDLLMAEPFILFMHDEKKPGQVRIRATVRNSSQWERWIYTRGTPARNVVVRFFDGNPDKGGKPIGTDQVIPKLDPCWFASAEVVWKLRAVRPGKHTIWVVVDPDNKIIEADDKRTNRASKVEHMKKTGGST